MSNKGIDINSHELGEELKVLLLRVKKYRAKLLISWEEKFEANVEDGDIIAVSGKVDLCLQDPCFVSCHTREHLKDVTLPLDLHDFEIVICLCPTWVWEVLKCFLTVHLITLSDHSASVFDFWQNITLE